MKETANVGSNSFADGLGEKLQRRFGLGSRPETRRAFYRRLELACEVHGERAWTQIRIVAAEAADKKAPANYFCRAVLCRLREGGLMPLADL